jgi:hypothetical protein
VEAAVSTSQSSLESRGGSRSRMNRAGSSIPSPAESRKPFPALARAHDHKDGKNRVFAPWCLDWERWVRGLTLEVDADGTRGLHLQRRLLLLPAAFLGWTRSVAARRARDAVEGAPGVQLRCGRAPLREHHGVDLMRYSKEQQADWGCRSGRQREKIQPWTRAPCCRRRRREWGTRRRRRGRGRWRQWGGRARGCQQGARARRENESLPEVRGSHGSEARAISTKFRPRV